MPRTLSFVVAWLVAAAVATLVAWQGVSVVSDQVTNDRPAPVDQADVREQLADESEPDPASAEATVPSTSTTSTTQAEPLGPQPGSVDPVPTPAAQAGGPSASPAPAAPAPSPPPPANNPPAPATTVVASEVRTYNLVGGSAALRFTPSGVTVDYATPKAGFTVDLEPENGNGVRVEFRSDDHRSRVDGWWDGGPRERVREEPDSSGSGSGSGSGDD